MCFELRVKVNHLNMTFVGIHTMKMYIKKGKEKKESERKGKDIRKKNRKKREKERKETK